MIADDGRKLHLVIRRLYCENCNRIHHELPDCLVPYKRHGAETIEKVISGCDCREVPCENRTIQRIRAWWKALLPYFLSILNSLAEKLNVTYSLAPALKEIVRAVVNSNNWIFAHQLCTRSVSVSG